MILFVATDVRWLQPDVRRRKQKWSLVVMVTSEFSRVTVKWMKAVEGLFGAV